MTDNFAKFKPFMQLPEEEGGDAYYTIELVRRGKDCPDLPAANYHFKNYYIDTMQKYERVQDEIRLLCKTLRLRAYISVNRKSFRRVIMNTIAEMAGRMAQNDFRRPYAVFESCSGKDLSPDDRWFIVDVDEDAFNVIDGEFLWERVVRIVNQCSPEGGKVVLMLRTKSGMHIIARPFNRIQFGAMCKADPAIGHVFDIQKNHLTLLYEDL